MKTGDSLILSSRPNILVIEDELGMRELLGYIFSRENYQIAMASNGVEAENILQSQNFDIILQDFILPYTN